MGQGKYSLLILVKKTIVNANKDRHHIIYIHQKYFNSLLSILLYGFSVQAEGIIQMSCKCLSL